jgi:hypothetical protein
MRESQAVCDKFFGGKTILQPNCTLSMKSILAVNRRKIAYLAPLYGATQKLIRTLCEPIVIDIGYFNECEEEILE